ncbi:DnaB-like helicase N-terminal domain-containing protein [Streptomyces sp. TLI_146]|uniref:DnaB-like helicase N-terminal domain-containing protein n=1 Tax=Streptomyces sp. TLI_146 TaxID=1938858 RepID=UPI000C701AF6|nr:DnaB-like helicase N-terminal domain-containing protein [Streptomyces sp. TLI_146]PKV84335.1 DnaB helicase-like protein [Streptomyces sp. TLI_146]
MPHPTPDHTNDLNDTPPPPPVHYAEQSLLGALLLDPHRLDEIGPLEPGHFTHPAHSELFRAMRTAPAPEAEQHRTSPVWLNSVLDAARPHAPGLTASYLHSLIQVCPWPQHAATYARMVRADHARRSLRLHAERLAQTAVDIALPHRAKATVQQAATLAHFLDDLSGRFTPHPSSLPRTALPPAPARDTSEEALDEERLLIATATAYPAETSQMRWLVPEDFALPLNAALWQCLAALAHRGDPLDPVTVLWEAQHRGLLVHGITPADLLALLSTPVGSPEHWGEKVLERALLSRAQTVAASIAAFTDDLANSPHQLITGSRRALADLNAVRGRWRQATGPATPRTTRPARTPAAPRAGPPARIAPRPVRVSR